MAAKYHISFVDTFAKINWFLKDCLKVHHVFDLQIAKDLSLMESAKEFLKRYETDNRNPMLASSCPGWICYAEKTHGQILSFIDTTKSPQQIMGSLVKTYFAPHLPSNQIYHVCGKYIRL